MDTTKEEKEIYIIKEFLNQELMYVLNHQLPCKEEIERAYHLIKLGANPLITLSGGSNILRIVICYGDIEWFKKFVSEFKFDLNNLDNMKDNQSSAFNAACVLLKPEIAEWLIKNHNISKETIQEKLYELCTSAKCKEKGSVEIAKVLIENGAKVQYKTFKTVNLLQRVGENPTLFEFLKKMEVEEKNNQSSDNKTIEILSDALKKADKEIATLKEQIDALKDENQKLQEKYKHSEGSRNDIQNYLKKQFIK